MKAALCEYIQRDLLPAGSDIEVQASDDLLNAGMLDSMKLMRLVQHIESTRNISIPPEDLVLENFRSVDAIAGYLDSRS